MRNQKCFCGNVWPKISKELWQNLQL
uniref:Uncharacterized protein n=1 Tax=Rhizophora mucronata TaxID=61149 RepID=A0A2P2QXN5_RHIMU